MRNRENLFKQYVTELSAQGLPYSPSDEIFKASFRDYTQKSYYEWIPIIKSGEEIGFMIIGTYPDCHNLADYYLAELYVLPKYRKQGIATKTVKEFWKTHLGKYTLVVINTNIPAQNFWKNMLAPYKNFLSCGKKIAITPFFDEYNFLIEKNAKKIH